jgi:hypothetical protein
MNVFCEQGWLAAFNALVAAGGLARIRLFQNNYVPSFTDTVTDYVEATFSGYPGFLSPTWGSAFVNGANQGEIDALPLTWAHNGGVTANLIYGIYITDGANNLAYAERFDAPVSMSAVPDFITYTPRSTVVNQ